MVTHQQHDEEDGGPGDRPWQLEHHLRVGEEDESRSALDHVGHADSFLHGDVAEDGEGHAAGQEASERVHHARDEGVPVRHRE